MAAGLRTSGVRSRLPHVFRPNSFPGRSVLAPALLLSLVGLPRPVGVAGPPYTPRTPVMLRLWLAIQRGYLRIIEPFAAWLVRMRGRTEHHHHGRHAHLHRRRRDLRVRATSRSAGWLLGLTALFDVLDGTVARRTGRTTTFGAFYDSTLDRVADGAVLGGLAVFFARNDVLHGVPHWAGTPMVALTILGIIGTFLTSYTRARAEALGLDAKVGIMQRPERVDAALGAAGLLRPRARRLGADARSS